MSKPEDKQRRERALHETTPRLGLTHGDFNGIGYEVILRCLSDSRILRLMTPVLYGSEAIYNYYRKRFALDLPERLRRIDHADEAREGRSASSRPTPPASTCMSVRESRRAPPVCWPRGR